MPTINAPVAEIPRDPGLTVCDGAEKIRAALRREVSASFCERAEEAAKHLNRLDGSTLIEAAHMSRAVEKQYSRRFFNSCAVAALSLPVSVGVAFAGSNTWQGAALGMIFAASAIFNAARIGGVVAENEFKKEQDGLLRKFEAVERGNVQNVVAAPVVVKLPVTVQAPVARCA